MKPTDENSPDTNSVADEDSGVVGSNPPPPTKITATFTPDWIADIMAGLAGIEAETLVLEPSAGQGALLMAIRRAGGLADYYELNRANFEACKAAGFAMGWNADFLRQDPDGALSYEAILMNPPMRGSDHVLHAFKFLSQGAKLVALIHADQAPAIQSALGGRTYALPDIFEFAGEPIAAVIYVVQT